VDNRDGSWSYFIDNGALARNSFLAVQGNFSQLYAVPEDSGPSYVGEKFTIGPNGELVSLINGLCVDLQNSQSSNGTPIQTALCR
jgi:hypothetical protein